MQKFIFSMVSIVSIVSMVSITSCEKDDRNDSEPTVYQRASDGMFVINEGNYYNGISGSLSFLDFATDSMQNKIFQAVNGRALGNTPNSGVVAQGKLYITGERIEVVDADTAIGKSVAVIETISQPRALAASDDEKYVFVSSYTGKVSKIDTSTDKVTKESEVVGSCLEGICYRDGYVYVCNAFSPGSNYNYTYHTNIVKLRASDLSKVCDITVACNPTAILCHHDGVFVQSTGNYADVGSMIQKIDAGDNVTNLCPGMYFAAYDDKLYVISTTYDADWNSVTSYNTYDITTGETLPLGENIGEAVAYPYNIAVNPKNGDIYISSLCLSEYGYGDYSSPGYVVRFDSASRKLAQYTVGVNPKSFCFTR